MSFNYDEHARRCAPDDLLRQICRTCQGQPVSQEQINLIVNAIKVGLALNTNDTLLEIACGNGSLSHYLFDDCKGYLGFDISDFLISVARNNFQRSPDYQFFTANMIQGLEHSAGNTHFNKLLCYAAIQYFSDEQLVAQLVFIKHRLSNIKRIFWGNIPDKTRADRFFQQKQPDEQELNDTQTAIGKWRSQDDIRRIAMQAGWALECNRMPTTFYASEYRFDAVLTCE